MGFIYKDRVPELIKGYPTRVNTNDIYEGRLSSDSSEGVFGDVVLFADKGFYKVADKTNTITSASQIAGVIQATNVKLDMTYGGGVASEVKTEKGGAFNRLVKGFIALELKAETNLATIVNGAKVGLTSDGKCELTTAESAIATDWVFTGVTSTDDSGRLLAEVEVK